MKERKETEETGRVSESWRVGESETESRRVGEERRGEVVRSRCLFLSRYFRQLPFYGPLSKQRCDTTMTLHLMEDESASSPYSVFFRIKGTCVYRSCCCVFDCL